jgi:hypothetical protein
MIRFNKFKLMWMLLISFLYIYILSFVQQLYIHANSQNSINVWNKQRFQDFYSMSRNSIDLVFVGSSHSYCSFNPEVFDQVLGINSFQLGMPLQHPDATYYTLREVFNYQRPDLVVMELYFDMLDDSFVLAQADSLFEVMNNAELYDEFVSEVFPFNEKLKNTIPLIKYQQPFINYMNKLLEDYLTDNGIIREYKPQQGEEYYGSKGYIYSDMVISYDEMYKDNQFRTMDLRKFDISLAQQKYLDKIIALCNIYNTKLIFITAPIAPVSLEFIDNYDDIYSTLKSYAQLNDVEYIDLNTDVPEDMFVNHNFRDDAHLNNSGADIASNYLAEYISVLLTIGI